MRVTLLLLSAAALFGQTAPDPSEVLESAREKIHAAMKRLPKYACLQTIDRTYLAPPATYSPKASCDQINADLKKGRKPLHLESTDRLRLEVAHGVDGEIHAYPAASRFDLTEIDQIVDSGPFGTERSAATWSTSSTTTARATTIAARNRTTASRASFMVTAWRRA